MSGFAGVYLVSAWLIQAFKQEQNSEYLQAWRPAEVKTYYNFISFCS